MERHWLDELAQALAGGTTRRSLLTGIVAGVAGFGVAHEAGAVICRNADVLCARNAQCCSGICDTDSHRCACPDGQTLCGRSCVDLTSDADHCGDCDTSCDADQSCQQGSCACDDSLLDDWADYARNSATVEVVCGNGAPGYSQKSVHFTLADTSDKAYINTTDYNGTALSDLNSLSYWTYVTSTPGDPKISVNIFLGSGDGVSNDYLVYEPYLQIPAQDGSNIAIEEWQQWDARSGLWWRKGQFGGPPYVSIDDYLGDHPDAVINSDGIALNTRSGWSSFDGNADACIINGDTWDF